MPSLESDDIPVVRELEPLAAEYLERLAAFNVAGEALEETKEIVMTILGDRPAARVIVDGKLRPIYFRQQDGKPKYKEAVEQMGEQFKVMRERLIQIGEPDAELIPVPSAYVKRGKPSRPLMMQYLADRKRAGE